ncbi:hypothetical protein [Streptomyces sp. NBC_00059]|uniref:hypothetical protein n=1 Tax=Streptomyces sp. NBC_00059 TaxID=2975635 RepID=UPI00225226DC|nr:hypothetical protein [Streptomyces sp. NBC_00059]MCX5412967.1 hypothetical protein [Streptomyces sp. NBC_00059]
MRQRIVRLTLVGGVLVLALLLLLATCGGGGGGSADDEPEKKPAKKSAGPATQLTVPPAYTTKRGWEIVGAGPGYALSNTTGRLAYLVRAPDDRYRLRTLDTETGRADWSGDAWRPAADPGHFPKLLTVAKDGQEFFVTWSHGKAGDGLDPARTFVSLDVYDAVDGERRRVEVPWTGAPTVTATGPGILISDGRADSAVVDPVSGEVSEIAASSVAYPKGCTACKQLTEVRGQTAKGLLLSGVREFWVRGGWFSRQNAPKGADPLSGVPTSVAPGLVLAKWQPAKGTKRAATHQLWTVHDSASGKPVVSVECHTPAIEPGRYPQAVVSPSGGYLVAGNLAFDLEAKKGFCFEDEGGTALLTLASVTDGGTAYGATTARDAAEALDGGVGPVSMSFTTWSVDALPPNTRLPEAETSGIGVFRWTDRKDRLHLLGYPRVG